MPTIPQSTALALATVLGALSLAQPASAGESCESYGRLALQQQKQNEDGKCGLTGPEWSSDLKAHIAWCGSPEGAGKWREMLKARTEKLAECLKSKS